MGDLATFAPCHARFFCAEFMRFAAPMRGLTAFAGDPAAPLLIHRGESTLIVFRHAVSSHFCGLLRPPSARHP
jgi:hypothetical protein